MVGRVGYEAAYPTLGANEMTRRKWGVFRMLSRRGVTPARVARPAAGQTRNFTIMSTDIVGSTGTTRTLARADYDAFRRRYDQIVKPLAAAGSGTIVKGLGDGYLVTYESATEAVLAAIAIQDQLRSMIATLQLTERCATRIGLSAGDVTVEDGDVFGMPVILATRVQSIAEHLTAYLTESVYLAMNRSEVACHDLGYISLKGLDEKVRVFRAERRLASPGAEDYAVLATDIGGFTSLVDRSDDVWATVLEVYDAVIFRHALAHRGFFRYNVGDSFRITFQRASDALDAARAIATELDRMVREDGLPALPFKLGLDFGALRMLAGRLIGSPISRTAPALADAGAGAIHASEAFVEQLAREDAAAAARLGAERMPPLPMRGVAEPLLYFRITP